MNKAVFLCLLAYVLSVSVVTAAPGTASRKLLAAAALTGTTTPTVGPIEGNTLINLKSGATFNVANEDVCCFHKTGSPTLSSPMTHTSGTVATCKTPKFDIVGAWQLSLAKTACGASASNPITFTPHATLLVSDFKTSSVMRFHADTGAFIDVFVQPKSGGLDGPWGLAFNPFNRDLYVSSERTNSVLVYDGSTGAFKRKGMTVEGQPRGLVFHYGDLYVASAYNDKVYRYNARTDSPRGVYAEGGGLDHPFSVMFDKHTNDTYISSEYKDHVYRFKPSTSLSLYNKVEDSGTATAWDLYQGVNAFKGAFDKVWTNTRTNYANGIEFTADSMYVTGPYSGKAIVRYNRTDGTYIQHFEDEYLNYPVDIKEYKDYLYVCSNNEVRKYNRYNGEFMKTFSQQNGLLGSFLLFHTNTQENKGR